MSFLSPLGNGARGGGGGERGVFVDGMNEG